MAVGGACPGMVLAQVGSGTHNAVYTLVGCFTGALTFGFIEPFITKSLKKVRACVYLWVWW